MAVEKVCEICGEKSRALQFHMKKHEAKSSGVSVEEFESYKKEANDKLDKILSLLEGKAEQPAVTVEPDPNEPPKDYGIPPEHEIVFSKYFDREDGFDAEIDIIENTFTIIVPPKFSNALPAHKDYYKIDKRMIKMENNNPVGSVEVWCQKVAKNLRYDKNLKTK